MKKLFLSFALMVLVVCSAFSQNASTLVSDFASKKDVVNVNIREFWMSAAKPFVAVSLRGDKDGKELMPLINSIKSVQVVTLSECEDKIKEDFVKKFHALQDVDGYETLVKVRDGKDNVRIMAKKSKDKIKELFIFCLDENDASIVKLSGNIKMSDIAALIEKYNK
jgi:hypothetical protein